MHNASKHYIEIEWNLQRAGGVEEDLRGAQPGCHVLPHRGVRRFVSCIMYKENTINMVERVHTCWLGSCLCDIRVAFLFECHGQFIFGPNWDEVQCNACNSFAYKPIPASCSADLRALSQVNMRSTGWAGEPTNQSRTPTLAICMRWWRQCCRRSRAAVRHQPPSWQCHTCGSTCRCVCVCHKFLAGRIRIL